MKYVRQTHFPICHQGWYDEVWKIIWRIIRQQRIPHAAHQKGGYDEVWTIGQQRLPHETHQGGVPEDEARESGPERISDEADQGADDSVPNAAHQEGLQRLPDAANEGRI